MRPREPIIACEEERSLRVYFVALVVVLSVVISASYFIFFDKEQPSKKTILEHTHPMVVWGYVNDSSDLPVNGAEVNVSIKDGTTLRTYSLTTSGDTGFYTVTIDPSLWDVNNTIEVVATYGLWTGSNSTLAGELGDEQIDVKLTTEIPEFGFIPVLVIAVCAVIILFRRTVFDRREF